MVAVSLAASLKDAYTIKDVAKILNCHPATANRYTTIGVRDVKLRCVIVGGKRLIPRGNLDAFLSHLNAENMPEEPDDSQKRGSEAGAALEALNC